MHLGDDAAARDLARSCNDVTAELMRNRPDRFGGFAILPLPDVAVSLDELALGPSMCWSSTASSC